MFDRSTILREAHAEARRLRRPSHYQRRDDRFDAEIGAWVPLAPYRVTFAACLRFTWHAHRCAAAEAAWEAAHPVPAAVQAQAAAIRADAWFEPINALGNARMASAFLVAASLVDAARFGAVQ